MLEQQNEIEREVVEESKRKNSLLTNIVLSGAGLLLGTAVQSPLLKRIDYQVGSKLLKNATPEFLDRLGKVSDNIVGQNNNLFLSSIRNLPDVSITNIVTKGVFNAPSQLNKYIYATQGNYIGYNIAQNLLQKENEPNPIKFMQYQNNLMLQLVQGNKQFLQTDIGKNIKDLGIQQSRKLQANIQALAITGSLGYKQVISNRKQFSAEVKEVPGIFKDLLEYFKEHFPKIKQERLATLESVAWKDINILKQAENILGEQVNRPSPIKRELAESVMSGLEGFIDERGRKGLTIREVIESIDTLNIDKQLKQNIVSLGNIEQYQKQLGYEQNILDVPIFDYLSKTSKGELKFVKRPAHEFLYNVKEFSEQYKIPFLNFNPLQMFQPRTLYAKQVRPLIKNIDINAMYGNVPLKKYVAEILVEDENVRNVLKQLIDQTDQKTPLQNQYLKFQTGLKNRDFLSDDFQRFFNFLSTEQRFTSFDDLVSKANQTLKRPVDERQILSDILLYSKTSKFENMFDFTSYVTRRGELSTIVHGKFKPTELVQPKDTRIKQFLETGSYQVDNLQNALTFKVTLDDQKYYAFNKFDIGSSLLHTIQLEQGTLQFKEIEPKNKVQKLIQKYDLPFNQKYSTREPIVKEWKEQFDLQFTQKSKLFNKSIESYQNTGNLKYLQNLVDIYNINVSKAIDDEVIKQFGININKTDINQYLNQYTEQMEYFGSLNKRLNKIKPFFGQDTGAYRFYKNLLPTQLETTQYRNIKSIYKQQQPITWDMLTARVTSLGEPMTELMDKSIQLYNMIKTNQESFEKQIQSINRESQIQLITFVKIQRHMQQQLERLDKEVLSFDQLQYQYRHLKNVDYRDYNLESMRSYITAQFKYQPDITRNMLQRTKERKFMYKIGFETTDTVILRSGIKPSAGNVPSLQKQFTHYIADRPNQLLDEIFLGRPNPYPSQQPRSWNKLFQNLYNYTFGAQNTGPYGAVMGTLTRRILPLYLGIEQFKQVDQLQTNKTGEDVPLYVPSKFLAETYTSFTQGLLKFGELTGIKQLSNFVSNRFPYLLPLSVQGIQQKNFGPSEVFLWGAAQSIFSNYKDPEQYALEVTGYKNVPVKSGRYWEFGRTPYLGGKTKYYRPSLPYLAGTRWQYTDTLWGSGFEYFKYGNIYGKLFAGGMFDPNYLAEKHVLDRPYLYLGVGFNNQFGVSSTNQTLGIIQNPLFEGNVEYQSIAMDRIGKIGKRVQDYLGFVGFMSEFVTPFEESNKPKLATPRLMSGSRLYYQKEIGGMLGHTEYLRRFVINYDNIYGSSYENPVPNLFMLQNFSWLPKNYFIDFYKGDVYSKFPYAEVRLPGYGYEQIHINDVYDKVTRYEILANVAPYSAQTTRMYNSLYKSFDTLTYQERYRVYSQNVEAQDVKTKIVANEYPFMSQTKKVKLNIQEILDNGMLRVEEENVPVRVQGVNLDIDQIAKQIFETENVNSIQEAYYEAQRRRQILLESFQNEITGEVWKDENRRYEMDQQGNVNLVLMNRKIGKLGRKYNLPYNENDQQDIRQRYLTNIPFVKQLQQFSESISHGYGLLFEKFGSQPSQLEQYERYEVFGTRSQSWNKPFTDFFKHSLFNIMNMDLKFSIPYAIGFGYLSGNTLPQKITSGLITGIPQLASLQPGSFIPNETMDRYEMEENYLKQKQIRGEWSLYSNAQTYSVKQPKELYSLLPGNERDYLPYFVNADEQTRRKLQEIQPSYTLYALNQLDRYKQMKIAGIEPQQLINPVDRDVQVQEYDELDKKYLNPYINLESLYTIEVFSQFDDTRKFKQYKDDLYKQYQSIKETDLNNKRVRSTYKNMGMSVISTRNYSNSNAGMYVNMAQPQYSYSY